MFNFKRTSILCLIISVLCTGVSFADEVKDTQIQEEMTINLVEMIEENAEIIHKSIIADIIKPSKKELAGEGSPDFLLSENSCNNYKIIIK